MKQGGTRETRRVKNVTHGMNIRRLAVFISVAGLVCAQTRIDLRSQSKTVDFSSSTSTRPFKTGVALPPLCQTGEMFFKTDAAPGKNLYACTATNMWTVSSGDLTQFHLTGDLAGTGGTAMVTGLQGKVVAPTAPANGQVLQWNQANGQWEPSTLSSSLPGQANHTHEFLLTDGQTPSWRAFVTGGSGAISLNKGAQEVTVDIQQAVVPLLSQENVWTGVQTYTPAASQTIDALADIVPNRAVVQIQSAGGDITVRSTPTIADGQDGQWLTIMNVHPTSTVKLQDEAMLPNSNLRVAGGQILAIAPREAVSFFFNAAVGAWVQVSGDKSGEAAPAGVQDPGANGFMVRVAGNTTASRAISGTPGKITVSNGDGVSGNPLIGIGSDVLDLTTPQNANTALFGPVSGQPGAPAFRSMAPSDLPNIGTGYLATVVPGTSLNTLPAVNSANTIRLYLMPVHSKLTISKAAVNVATAGGAAAKVRIGIYNASCGALVFQSGAIDASSTGLKTEPAISPVTITPGYYYVAWSATDASVRVSALNTNSVVYSVLNAHSSPVLAEASESLDASGNFPSSCGSLSSTNAPLPGIAFGQ
jgi:hypothetical protein